MLKKRGGERQIEINGQPWAWRLAGMEVLLRRPDDTKVMLPLTILLPLADFWSIQHDMSKKNFRLKPGHVTGYIRRNIEMLLAMSANSTVSE